MGRGDRPEKWYEMTWTKKWDEMSRYEIVLTWQVPEPECYPAGLFGACLSRSPKNKTDPICGKQDKKSFWSEKSLYQGQKCPVTQDACFHDLHKIFNNFLSL